MPKKENIEQMFDDIAPSYDKLNHILSLDVDKAWRRRAVRSAVDVREPLSILDLACGTGDMSIALARGMQKKNGAGHKGAKGKTGRSGAEPVSGNVVGIDLSENMLEICRRKITKAGFDEIVRVQQGDGENLPFPDGSFDRVTIAFGIRNFEHIDLGLREMLRVLKPGGKVVILELSMPRNRLVARLYRFYFTRILPAIGGKASGDRASYNYLPASVIHFPAPESFMGMMRAAGFTDIAHKALTFGICRMFIGTAEQSR